MTCLWGIILWSSLLYSLKDSSNFSSYLGFILLPLDNTSAESFVQRCDFKLDTLICGCCLICFCPKSLDVEIIYFSFGVSFLWVCFAGCHIIGELLSYGCATILAKCFLQSTMDSEEHSTGNPHPIPSVFSFFMNL
jgi:hypothetical protein